MDRHPASVDASSTARAFGATIETRSRAGSALYLVVGHRHWPEQAVTTAGGQVVVRLPGEPSVLAIIPVTAERMVQRHADVVLVGAVTIDPVRFAHFARMARLDGGPERDGPVSHGP